MPIASESPRISAVSCQLRWRRRKSLCSNRLQRTAFFPNDGVRITPRYITKVTDYEGRVLEEDYPEVKDVISARTARIMTSMLREVVLHGTGIAAAS